VTSTPVLRPLLTLDKEEIVIKAKQYGTFETSIQPFEDCCTIFTPKNPVTEPDFEKVERYESVYDFSEMIDRAVEGIETIEVTKNYQSQKDKTTEALMEDLF
ncbi:MAG: tRNA 4-thiouridine(8) synthase ThiI, partial [Staphylococcus simulans]|nr:tRNA 4-thiouridine(8) synthase ThiI [Staphylococcus simulans]